MFYTKHFLFNYLKFWKSHGVDEIFGKSFVFFLLQKNSFFQLNNITRDINIMDHLMDSNQNV